MNTNDRIFETVKKNRESNTLVKFLNIHIKDRDIMPI